MPQRITKPTLRLLEVMLTDPSREWYGLELMDSASLRSGTVYPILHRLETDGWLTSAPEDVDPVDAGRPRRRLYRLTAVGEAVARGLLPRPAAQLPKVGPLLPEGAIR